MKIGIDCRLAGEKHAGIGRYIEELVRRVVNDESIDWVLFFYEKDQIVLAKQKNVRIVIAPIRHYSLREQIQMPGIFSREHLDLLHVPHYNVPLFYRGQFVVTIHDLLWHTHSNAAATTLSPLMHAIKYRGYKRVVDHAITQAASIFVPARTVKQEILRLFPHVSDKKINVTYEGVDKKFQIPNTKLQTNANSQMSKVLFYTGSLYPHKNLLLVVQALRSLPGYTLAISSSRTVFVDQFLVQVEHLGLSDRVQHLGRLSDAKLLDWYANSTALVQPSLSEGFGLTGVEAMAAGLPVLASEIPVFQEIYQDGCLFFDPNSTASFVRAVKDLENSDRRTIVEAGRAVAAQYSWDKMAKETLTIYHSLSPKS